MIGGRVKKVYFWDLSLLIVIILFIYINCINSINFKIKYYRERTEK